MIRAATTSTFTTLDPAALRDAHQRRVKCGGGRSGGRYVEC